MTKPNLFTYATSELSQDAFICWLLSWAKPEYKNIDANLHQCGVDLIKTFFVMHGKSFPAVITSIEVKKQDEHIDVLCIVNGEFPIIIEDKTQTKNSDHQLATYLSRIESRTYQKENIIPIYFKTYDQSNYIDVVEKNKYQVFSRLDFLSILNKGTERGIDNAIFQDFRSHLQKIEDRVQSYLTHEMNNWSSASWVGFFMTLQKELDTGTWGKVNNATGGFMGFWWRYSNEKPYLQLEQNKLCFKIRVDDKSKQKSVRNEWHKLIRDRSIGLNLTKPTRFGSGKYMTVIIAKDDYRCKGVDGLIDINATIQYLKKIDTFIKEIQQVDISA
jgi:hypothetical protein